MTIDADDDVPRVRVEGLPEDREVVRDEERRDRDGDDVDEHLRPPGDEAHELVERVSREARRASGLREARGAFRVRRRRRGEDDARDDEDERRQPERVDGGEAERVVDRGADVAVGGREERGGAEHPLHLDLTPAPASGHGGEAYSWRKREGPACAGPSSVASWDLRVTGSTRTIVGFGIPAAPEYATDPRYFVPAVRPENVSVDRPGRSDASAAAGAATVMFPASAEPSTHVWSLKRRSSRRRPNRGRRRCSRPGGRVERG